MIITVNRLLSTYPGWATELDPSDRVYHLILTTHPAEVTPDGSNERL